VAKERVISERSIGKDVEGSGRGLIKGNIPAFTWKNSGQ
jgi:hypothetical protein